MKTATLSSFEDGNTATRDAVRPMLTLPIRDAEARRDEQGGRAFVAGAFSSVTVTSRGFLCGSCRHVALRELIGLEMLELFADEDLDTSKVPSNNDDFTITITAGSEREIHAVEHGRSGHLFRTCDMTYTAPLTCWRQSERVLQRSASNISGSMKVRSI